MINKAFKRILDSTPKETHIFVSKYTDFVIRVNQLLEEKGWTQENSSNSTEYPPQINKWLNGEHELTLRAIAKLEAELGETILEVTQKQQIDTPKNDINITNEMSGFKKSIYTVYRNQVQLKNEHKETVVFSASKWNGNIFTTKLDNFEQYEVG